MSLVIVDKVNITYVIPRLLISFRFLYSCHARLTVTVVEQGGILKPSRQKHDNILPKISQLLPNTVLLLKPFVGYHQPS